MITIGDCEICGRRCRAGSKFCATCETVIRKAAKIQPSDNNSTINKRSAKGKDVDRRYLNRLRTWKRGKKCTATFPHECSRDVTCHHQFGRGDHYHDELAEQNELPLTLDERFWIPLCTVAHKYITEHSRFAWEHGYSYKRVSDPLFHRENKV